MKQFRITWLYGYGDSDGKSEWHERAWFSDFNGLGDEEQKLIDAMKPGDVLTLPVPMSAVRIVRGDPTFIADAQTWQQLNALREEALRIEQEYDEAKEEEERATSVLYDAMTTKDESGAMGRSARADSDLDIARHAWHAFFMCSEGERLSQLEALTNQPRNT